MRFTVLGPVQALGAGGVPADLGPRKPRMLLAALLLYANEWVTADRLTELLWPGKAPGTAVGSLKTYAWQLRKALSDVDDSGVDSGVDASGVDAAGQRLTSRRGGNRLEVGRGELDAWIFEDRNTLGQAALSAGAAGEAVAHLTSALALWRGEPYAELDVPAIRDRLTDQRWAVRENLAAARSALGDYPAAIRELRTLVTEQPLRESTWVRLMSALYRAGFRDQALEFYGRVEQVLAEELGVDPAAELRELRDRILGAQEPAVGQGRNFLPRDIPDFTGRGTELAEVIDGSADVVAVDGMPGAGKTAFAVHAAHLLAGRYPDAQLYLDLGAHGAVSPPVALASLLAALGVSPDIVPESMPDRIALWHARLTGKRVVLVLDNASGADQIRPLLPGPGSVVLVTSQRPLRDLPSHRVPLGPLPAEAAAALFRAAVGDDRPVKEPGATIEVVQLCGGLPMAIRIAGARLQHRPVWTVTHLANRLRDPDRLLIELHAEGTSLTSEFAAAYQALSSLARRAFRVFGADIDIEPGTVSVLSGLSFVEAEGALAELVDANLLSRNGYSYECHVLLRAYARTLAQQHADQHDRGDQAP